MPTMSVSIVRITVPMNRTMKPHMIAAWKTPAYGSRLPTVRLVAVATMPADARRRKLDREPNRSSPRPRRYFRSLSPSPMRKTAVAIAART